MGKKLVGIILLFLVVVGAGIGYLALGTEEKSQTQITAPTAVTPTPPASPSSMEPVNTEPAPVAQAGKYAEYYEGIVEATSGTKVLFFHAPWCPQCRSLEADIKASTIPTGVTIIKVDYDTAQTLRQKYGVTLQTTMVRVDDTGQLVKKFVAYDEPTLASVIKNVL